MYLSLDMLRIMCYAYSMNAKRTISIAFILLMLDLILMIYGATK